MVLGRKFVVKMCISVWWVLVRNNRNNKYNNNNGNTMTTMMLIMTMTGPLMKYQIH